MSSAIFVKKRVKILLFVLSGKFSTNGLPMDFTDDVAKICVDDPLKRVLLMCPRYKSE